MSVETQNIIISEKKKKEIPDYLASLKIQSEFFNQPENIEKIDSHHLNNFWQKLSGGYQRNEYFEIVGKDTFSKHLEGLSRQQTVNRENYSDKRLNETPQNFFNDIDQAISESEIDLKKLEYVMNKIELLSQQISEVGILSEKGIVFNEKKVELINELNNNLVSVYRKLREQGYSHADLVD